ncbi:bifunctional heptose 7-phosphate kinase/heptose 1-phosphate adenyltransferase [Vampirovibrio sp.]|uniref:bifunctional heptose 7-phosphate kinase/heptose 1-phosphate adenyltransferase n=1 Tax=Vampirovibrio sp. TaxID=2717857 RepID=UPI0035930E02
MKEMLSKIISKLSQGRILVIGDLVIDEMIYGATHRLSREAPVLILRHQRADIILGGGANAAHNVSKLNAKRTTIVGVSGKDYYCSLLMDALQRDGIDTAGLIQDEDRPTSTKTRISGIANHSVTQQIVRIDRESSAPISAQIENRMLDTLTRLAPNFDAMLLSDYGLGVFTPAVIAHCQALAKKHGLIMAVDSQQDLSAFQGATVLTPNQPEAEKNVGYDLHTPENVQQAGKDLLAKTSADSVLITRGESGMTLFESLGNPSQPKATDIPVFNHSEVFDVTGAGDTVVGTLTLALTAGASLLEASILGNLAASIVVKRFGAATTNPQELQAALDSVDESLLNRVSSGILSA